MAEPGPEDLLAALRPAAPDPACRDAVLAAVSGPERRLAALRPAGPDGGLRRRAAVAAAAVPPRSSFGWWWAAAAMLALWIAGQAAALASGQAIAAPAPAAVLAADIDAATSVLAEALPDVDPAWLRAQALLLARSSAPLGRAGLTR